jgi:hypothetical protein
MKMERIESSETSANNTQTPGTYPKESKQQHNRSLISNFRRVLNVVFLLLGDSPAPEFYMPTFRNTLLVPSS